MDKHYITFVMLLLIDLVSCQINQSSAEVQIHQLIQAAKTKCNFCHTEADRVLARTVKVEICIAVEEYAACATAVCNGALDLFMYKLLISVMVWWWGRFPIRALMSTSTVTRFFTRDNPKFNSLLFIFIIFVYLFADIFKDCLF
ncbi:hypothetical protein Btru_056936 [Bulinus truncatus]|nr:hypothetical protein Btru_056936 [Bulinus truncatus]